MWKFEDVAEVCVLLLVTVAVSTEHNVTVLTGDYRTNIKVTVDENRECIIRFPPSEVFFTSYTTDQAFCNT